MTTPATPEHVEPDTTPAPDPDEPTAEERETAFALDALCRTIEEAKAAIAAKQKAA